MGRHHPPIKRSRRTFWRSTDTTTSPKKKQERRAGRDRRENENEGGNAITSGTRRGGEGSSWNSYVVRRKVVGNEVIIFSGKSRQLDRRREGGGEGGGEEGALDTAKVDGKNVWWTNIRSFDRAVGQFPWITNEFEPRARLLPAFTPSFREKLWLSGKVTCSVSTSPSGTDDTPVTDRHKQVNGGQRETSPLLPRARVPSDT